MTEGKDPFVVFATAPSAVIALEVGRRRVDERLAACASVVPEVTSIFVWEGKREEAPHAERYPALRHPVLGWHTDSVPEVLAVPVEAGAPAHLRWIQESVGAEGR